MSFVRRLQQSDADWLVTKQTQYSHMQHYRYVPFVLFWYIDNERCFNENTCDWQTATPWENSTHVWNKILESLHNFWTLRILVILEDARHDDNECQRDTKPHLMQANTADITRHQFCLSPTDISNYPPYGVWKGILFAVFCSVQLQISRRQWHWSMWNLAWWYTYVFSPFWGIPGIPKIDNFGPLKTNIL